MHKEIFEEGGYFSETIQYPIVINLFLPLATIVKQGLEVIVTFGYNKNPCKSDLVVCCKDCAQEIKLPLRGPWDKAPRGNSCNFVENNNHVNAI